MLGEARDFCCAGCLAAAQTISASGLEEYYLLRTGSAPTVPAGPEPGELLLDREELQSTFVRRVNGFREVSLAIEDVRCSACLWLNERRLRSLPGVVEASVNYSSRTARVRWDPSRVALSTIAASFREIGYRARPLDPSHRASAESDASRRDMARLVFAGAVGMMVMNLALAAYFLGGSGGRLPLWETFGRWCEMLACAALLAYSGKDFFFGFVRDLRHRRLGMDVPVVLGLVGAWGGSAWNTVLGSGPVYYDAVAMLVFFLLLARVFETRARLSAAAALDRFAIVSPAIARRVEADGSEREVAALDLRPGDVIRVRPGDLLAADGTVLEGESAFDESILTGEPWPRRRGRGDSVVAGSVNRDQPVLVRVASVGESSTAGEIRRLLEASLASRPASAQLADRLAGPLVAALLVLAGATALLWTVREPARAFPAALSVLMVTCPCALALATPVAWAIAAARLAGIGVLPVRMAALERLASAEVAAFDKTGTLTLPAPRLAEVVVVGDLDREQALAVASALEADSPQPVACALRAAAGRLRRPAEAVVHHDRGVEGTVGGARWWIGSPAFALAPAGGSWPLASSLRADLGSEGGRLAAVLTDRRGRAALFAFEETLRSGAAGMLAELKRSGVQHTALVSGDASGSVERLARGLGFDEARAGLSPAAKLEWIRSRELSSRPVLFVGDGLNDAPTLAAASVSMSFGEAPQLARFASDFAVLGEHLGAIGAARAIARRSRRLLRQNLGWALAYNLVSVPLAAAGLLPPWAAALGMSASSLLVVANALRLRRPASDEFIEN